MNLDDIQIDVGLNADEATSKAKDLIALLKEAKTLVNDLASDLSNLTFDIKG